MSVTGPADLRDQKWLDEQIAAIETGVASVIDIYRNWDEGRNLSRLHPGSAFDYIKATVPSFTLSRKDVPALLDGTNLSFNAIAQLTSTSQPTVTRVAGLSTVNNPKPRVATTGKPAKGGRPKAPAATTSTKEKPAATSTPTPPPAPRPVPALIIQDDWDKVLSSMSLILAAREDHVIAHLNTLPDDKRKAGRSLLRNTSIRLNHLYKEVNP